MEKSQKISFVGYTAINKKGNRKFIAPNKKVKNKVEKFLKRFFRLN